MSDTTVIGYEKNPEMLQHGSVKLVVDFIECFNENRIDDALSLLAGDVFYHNIPMEPIVGRNAVEGFFKQFGIGESLTSQWLLTAIAAHGDVVLTERVDIFHQHDGRSMEIPLMGSFRIKDGKIAEWRDYFDLGDFQRKFAVLTHTPDNGEC